jgi:para-nitrobenzyl esterase
VSINYRLGPFGFLDLSEVGGPAYARSRNLGLLDQLAALRWVRANIAAFGGDAGNITVFGESAGGSAIMRLLGMPLARGLFDKAIIESGGPANIRVKGYPKTDDVPAGRALTREMMRETGVTDLAGLLALPADAVLAAAGAVARRRGDTMGVTTWGARVDDLVLPADVFGNIRRGVNPGVKVLIGTNEDEMLYFRLYDQDFERGLMREYHATATAMGRSFGKVKALADRYIAGSRDPKRYVDFAGEFWIRQPSILLAEGQSHHSDVFMYLWTWDSQVPGLGAAHAIELPFVFGNLRDQSAVALTGTNPPAALSRRIQAAWAAFALTGNPTAAGDTAWPRYTAASRATMLLSDGPWRLVDDPKGDDRQILREMYDVETR